VRSRIVVSAVAAVTVTLVAGGCGSTAEPPATPSSAVAPIVKASYMKQFNGDVVTESDGFALYVFQPDHRQRATCTGSCAAIWPPVLEAPNRQATPGVGIQASLLGSDPYSSNRSVVTYNGWPLYTYANDTTTGVAAGQGVNLNGGYWYVMRPDGVVLVPPGDPPAS
jgi:predicted lipoprotein with Yx(FWY)xxD motif